MNHICSQIFVSILFFIHSCVSIVCTEQINFGRKNTEIAAPVDWHKQTNIHARPPNLSIVFIKRSQWHAVWFGRSIYFRWHFWLLFLSIKRVCFFRTKLFFLHNGIIFFRTDSFFPGRITFDAVVHKGRLVQIASSAASKLEFCLNNSELHSINHKLHSSGMLWVNMKLKLVWRLIETMDSSETCLCHQLNLVGILQNFVMVKFHHSTNWFYLAFFFKNFFSKKFVRIS